MRLVFLVFVIVLSQSLFGQNLSIDVKASSINFKIKNFGMSVDGEFKTFSGNITFDPHHPAEGNISIHIDVNSIDTGVGLRDKHLKKEEFFNAISFPEIAFSSSSIENLNGSWRLKGRLTMKGMTRDIVLPFSFVPLDHGFRFVGMFKVNRRDFDVGGNSFSMGDEVEISVSILAK